MSLALPLLQRYYAALSPTTPSLIPSPPFLTARDLSAPSTQQWLVDNLLQLSNGEDEEQSGQAWKKVFWRRVVKGIEEGFDERRSEGDAEVEEEEVHEMILEELVKHLSSSSAPSERLARTYFWGPLEAGAASWSRVQTTEEGRMISAGTTGLRTWQACICLSNHLIASPSLLKPSPAASPPTILELGAGVGLLSLVAGRLAPDEARIVATDVDEKVLQQLNENVELNGLANIVKTRKFDWELASRLSEPAVKEELEEWELEAFGEAGRASLILGADIVYDPSLASLLASTLSYLLRPFSSTDATPLSPPPSQPTAATALIAGTIRNLSTWELFLSCCRKQGLSVVSEELQAPAEQSGIVGAEGWEGEGEVRLVRITKAS